MANTVSIDALRREAWQKELYKDAIDNLYFMRNGLMGKEDNNIVQLKNDLAKEKGDTITLSLTTKLTGSGVSGDAELEGNEEAISSYSEQIAIDQKRFAVRLTGQLDEQKNIYDMRADAKDKLVVRLDEFIERQVFLKLGGVTLTTVTDITGAVISADSVWSNTPDLFPQADTAAGYGNRYLCADYAAGADSLASTDLLTPALLSRLKVKAQTAVPKIKPLRIGGKEYYVVFVHPWQNYDLRENTVWAQAQREANIRGKENPIFSGADAIWDGLIIHSHEYVPFLDISAVGYNFNAAASGTSYGADAFRAILCGQQAVAFAKCKNTKGWVEKTFDYENKTGFATGIIGGIQKIMFNSKEYAVVVLDTAATALV